MIRSESKVQTEMNELVRDKIRRCAGCRRRMQFCPVLPEVVVRAPGQRRRPYCADCVRSRVQRAAALHGDGHAAGVLADLLLDQGEVVMEQLDEFARLPTSDVQAWAMDMLSSQLELLMEEVLDAWAKLKQLDTGAERTPGQILN